MDPCRAGLADPLCTGIVAKMAKQFSVYILASRPHGTLYVGVTSNLSQRVEQHKLKEVPSFTARYGVHRLVYFEEHPCAESAILREKQLRSGTAIGRFG
jgi:putative endonuclease